MRRTLIAINQAGVITHQHSLIQLLNDVIMSDNWISKCWWVITPAWLIAIKVLLIYSILTWASLAECNYQGWGLSLNVTRRVFMIIAIIYKEWQSGIDWLLSSHVISDAICDIWYEVIKKNGGMGFLQNKSVQESSFWAIT